MGIIKPSKQQEELIKLLKKSGSQFNFDPNTVKPRLLTSIAQADQLPVRHFRVSRVAAYSTSFAALVIMISTTLAFASTSRPGDRLFQLNKLGEQVILNLPLPVEQKAQVQAHIVTNRLEALDQVVEARELETVKESDESFSAAVNAITENKKKLEASGKTEQALKLEKVLDQLETNAQNKEEIFKKIEEKSKDSGKREEIRKHLKRIQDSRFKARSEIKRFRDNPDRNPDRTHHND